MNILLTNDDGYNSLGITLLKRLLSKYGEVTLIAPATHMSGQGAAITLNKGLTLTKYDDSTYSLNGTPVDCVSFALSTFTTKFDLVVSGCNDGENVSFDTMYSGTIGASLEAIKFNVPSIACSSKGNFSLVESYFDEVYNLIIKNKLLSNEYFISVNFPEDKVTDIKLSKLFFRESRGYYVKRSDGLYYATRSAYDKYSDDETDCYQVNNGIISLTPISKTYFSEKIYNEIKSKFSK
ncbi:MAG: 5'/3'-nucleotidase SurE [Bacilli bacterium]